MNRSRFTIRQISAAAMLLVMMFSITPRKTIHDIFGCHKEGKTAVAKTGGDQLTKKTFHCDCSQADFQTPYLNTLPAVLFISQQPEAAAYSFYTTAIFENITMFSAMRGPPTLA